MLKKIELNDDGTATVSEASFPDLAPSDCSLNDDEMAVGLPPRAKSERQPRAPRVKRLRRVRARTTELQLLHARLRKLDDEELGALFPIVSPTSEVKAMCAAMTDMYVALLSHHPSRGGFFNLFDSPSADAELERKET